MKKSTFFITLIFLLSTSALEAREGFYLGHEFSNERISTRSDGVDAAYINSLDSGGGMEFHVGYGINEIFAFEISLFSSTHDSDLTLVTGGEMDDQTFTGSVLLGKVNLPLKGRVDPYITAGTGSYHLGGGKYEGNGVQYGIGIDFDIVRHLFLNVVIMQRNITFDSGTWHPDDVKAESNRVGIGIHFDFR